MSDFLAEVERLKQKMLTRNQRAFLKAENGPRWACNPPHIADYKSAEMYVTDLGRYVDRCVTPVTVVQEEPGVAPPPVEETVISRCLHGSKPTPTCSRECFACGCTCDVHLALVAGGKACSGGANGSCSCPGWVETPTEPAAARKVRHTLVLALAIFADALDGLGLDPAQALLVRQAQSATGKAVQSLLDDEEVRARTMSPTPGPIRPMTETGREYLKGLCRAEYRQPPGTCPRKLPANIARPLFTLGYVVPFIAPPGHPSEGLFVPTDAGRAALKEAHRREIATKKRLTEGGRRQLRTMIAGKGGPVFINNKTVASGLIQLGYVRITDRIRGTGRARHVLTPAGRKAIEQIDAEPRPKSGRARRRSTS